MHNRPIRPGLKWFDGSAPTQRDFAAFDTLQSQAVTIGGAHSPATPITIGGAGLTIVTNTASATIRGGVVTRRGGRIRLDITSAYPKVSPARTRTIWMPATLIARIASPDGTRASFDMSTDPLGIIPYAVPSFLSFPIPKRYIHHGATLSTVTVHFRVRSLPAAIPTKPRVYYASRWSGTNPGTAMGPYPMPSWTANNAYALNDITGPTETKTTGYYYKATVGGISAPAVEPVWPTVIGNTVVDGTVTWRCEARAGQLAHPASPDAYYTNGDDQSLIADLDTSNVIDRQAYRYDIALDNFNSTTLLTGIALSYTAINDLRPE